jgi:hypothetical protein
MLVVGCVKSRTVGRLLPTDQVLDSLMTTGAGPSHLDAERRVVIATREIAASADSIFALTADPSEHLVTHTYDWTLLADSTGCRERVPPLRSASRRPSTASQHWRNPSEGEAVLRSVLAPLSTEIRGTELPQLAVRIVVDGRFR